MGIEGENQIPGDAREFKAPDNLEDNPETQKSIEAEEQDLLKNANELAQEIDSVIADKPTPGKIEGLQQAFRKFKENEPTAHKIMSRVIKASAPLVGALSAINAHLSGSSTQESILVGVVGTAACTVVGEAFYRLKVWWDRNAKKDVTPYLKELVQNF